MTKLEGVMVGDFERILSCNSYGSEFSMGMFERWKSNNYD